jgi:hypothetical protein
MLAFHWMWAGAAYHLAFFRDINPAATAFGVLTGLQYPRLPTFGVPCPTVILTAGALLLAPRRETRPLAVFPILMAGVGGSAAFLLDIQADIALLAAGVVLLISVLSPPRRVPQARLRPTNNG